METSHRSTEIIQKHQNILALDSQVISEQFVRESKAIQANASQTEFIHLLRVFVVEKSFRIHRETAQLKDQSMQQLHSWSQTGRQRIRVRRVRSYETTFGVFVQTA